MSKILFCDGHNLAFRAFYGIRELNRSDGFPTNMIHGWLRTMWRLEDEFSPNEMHIFFDRGGSHRREKILPAYKANRGLPPDGFNEQLRWVKKLTNALGHNTYEMEGKEADDLIASAVRQKKSEVNQIVIVSSDKDLAQLVETGVEQLVPPPTANPKLGWRILDSNAIQQKFGVSPGQILDYLSVIGDQSDNIPGLSGVGPKTATKWLAEFTNIENLIENAGRLTPKRFCSVVYENREKLLMNRELIRLEADVEFEIHEPRSADLVNLEKILTEMEMIKSWDECLNRYSPN